MNKYLDFLNALSRELYEENFDNPDYLTEGVLDSTFISTTKINDAAIAKLFAHPDKILVTTDGKWAVNAKFYGQSSGTVFFADSSNFGKTGKTKYFKLESINKGDALNIDDKGFDNFISGRKFYEIEASDELAMNPYAAKKVPAYKGALPSIGYNRLKPADIIAMATNGQIKSFTDYSRNPSNDLIGALKNSLSGYSSKVTVTNDNNGARVFKLGSVSFYPDETKFAKEKASKISSDPGDLKVDGKTPKVGAWFGTSVHYTMLAGANAYQIVGFKGKSIVIQEYGMTDISKDGATRLLVVAKPLKKVGGEMLARVGTTGIVKINGKYAHYCDDVDSVRFTGSAYD